MCSCGTYGGYLCLYYETTALTPKDACQSLSVDAKPLMLGGIIENTSMVCDSLQFNTNHQILVQNTVHSMLRMPLQKKSLKFGKTGQNLHDFNKVTLENLNENP
jgi:hypothetical protein